MENLSGLPWINQKVVDYGMQTVIIPFLHNLERGSWLRRSLDWDIAASVQRVTQNVLLVS